jgi:hypothetical protein
MELLLWDTADRGCGQGVRDEVTTTIFRHGDERSSARGRWRGREDVKRLLQRMLAAGE